MPDGHDAGRAGSAGTTPTKAGGSSGYRNAQVTVIAPTGTIGFMMDCDTTGIEPDLALIKYKKLVGGGVIKIVNNTVPPALIKLGYSPEQVEKIVTHIDSTGTIEGAPDLKPEHLAVFDCSFRPQNGVALHPLHGPRQDDGGGAAVHLGRDLEDHQHARRVHGGRHHDGLHRKLEAGPEGGGDLPRQLQARAAAQFGIGQGREEERGSRGDRSRCSRRAGGEEWSTGRCAASCPTSAAPSRTSSPSADTKATSRSACTTTAAPGEIFITMAKEGSTISGLMDAFATAVSFNLQYGVPLKFLVDKFAHVRFEPSGWTGNQQIPYAKSIMDYIFRWLGAKFLGPEYAVSEAGETMTLRPTEPIRSRSCRSTPR